MKIIDHDEGGYGFTELGQDLGTQLIELSKWSIQWAETLD